MSPNPSRTPWRIDRSRSSAILDAHGKAVAWPEMRADGDYIVAAVNEKAERDARAAETCKWCGCDIAPAGTAWMHVQESRYPNCHWAQTKDGEMHAAEPEQEFNRITEAPNA